MGQKSRVADPAAEADRTLRADARPADYGWLSHPVGPLLSVLARTCTRARER